eukprot:1122198-Prorocentrum_lima.AAC.1
MVFSRCGIMNHLTMTGAQASACRAGGERPVNRLILEAAGARAEPLDGLAIPMKVHQIAGR